MKCRQGNKGYYGLWLPFTSSWHSRFKISLSAGPFNLLPNLTECVSQGESWDHLVVTTHLRIKLFSWHSQEEPNDIFRKCRKQNFLSPILLHPPPQSISNCRFILFYACHTHVTNLPNLSLNIISQISNPLPHVNVAVGNLQYTGHKIYIDNSSTFNTLQVCRHIITHLLYCLRRAAWLFLSSFRERSLLIRGGGGQRNSAMTTDL